MATVTLLGKSGILRDYLALAKPRVILLHLVTAASAMFLAVGGLPPGSTLFFTLLGGGLTAGAANALNCYFDRDLDVAMPRTQRRPLAAGRLKPNQAIAFAVITGAAGLFILSWLISLAAAALALAALAYYVVIYTLWLKRRTYWSSLIGSGAGAFSPLIGWVAVTGRIGTVPLLLAGIIILWTPPHFWSLGIFRRKEYASAGLEVIPSRNAALWIFISAVLLVAVTLILGSVAGLGLLYFVAASLLGAVLLVLAVRLWHSESLQAARRLFFYSILYLVLLFGVMIIDRLL